MERYPLSLGWNIVINKMSLPKVTYIQCNPYQKSNDIFTETEKNPKISIELQKISNSQSNLDKEEQSWKHHTFNFKLDYKAMIIKTVMIVA